MIGQDEQRILDALKSPAVAAKQRPKVAEDLRAKYKIEIHFGKDRSGSNLRSSVGAILIWESGRRFHGGGDDKMYWCGYPDCDRPIKTELFGFFHVVCPSCKRECFLANVDRDTIIQQAKKEGKSWEALTRMPTVTGEKLFRLPPNKLAKELERHWRNLDCHADIYVKYHPSDIRYRALEENAKTPDQLEKARRLRGLMIYPLKNILKDTVGGASVQKRFYALVTA